MQRLLTVIVLVGLAVAMSGCIAVPPCYWTKVGPDPECTGWW